MKLEHPYVLKLSGDPERFILSQRDKAIAMHLVERLLSGQEVAVEELESWGLRVELVDEFVRVERGE